MTNECMRYHHHKCQPTGMLRLHSSDLCLFIWMSDACIGREHRCVHCEKGSVHALPNSNNARVTRDIVCVHWQSTGMAQGIPWESSLTSTAVTLVDLSHPSHPLPLFGVRLCGSNTLSLTATGCTSAQSFTVDT